MVIHNIPVKVNKKYLNVYRSIKEYLAQSPSFTLEYSSLFMLCACLGFRECQQVTSLTDKFDGVELMRSQDMDEHQQTILKVFAIKLSGNYEILEKPDQIILLAERVAERGMEILIDKILKEDIYEINPGEYSLKSSAKRLNEQVLGMFIKEELERNAPFYM
ncbi:MAG: hypothetical protein H6Q73_1248 [Firmicutes bacterium]|nr:hypothetical protein [Bacillota bacterium]